jgi:hypothetical protein
LVGPSSVRNELVNFLVQGLSNPSFHGAIGAAVASGLGAYFNKKNKSVQVLKNSGWRYLRYGWYCRSVSILASLVFGIFLYLTFAIANYATSSQGMLFARITFASFTVFGVCLFYEYFLRQVRFNATFVESHHPFGSREMAIAEIVDVKFHPNLGIFRLISSNGRQIWMPAVSGSSQFMRLLRNKFRSRVLDDILIDNISNLDDNAAWQKLVVVGNTLESEGLTNAQLQEKGMALLTLSHEAAWVWKPELGSEIKVLISTGSAYLCVRGHDFLLKSNDTISLKNPIQDPFVIVNISETDCRILVAGTISTPPSPQHPSKTLHNP